VIIFYFFLFLLVFVLVSRIDNDSDGFIGLVGFHLDGMMLKDVHDWGEDLWCSGRMPTEVTVTC